MSTKTWKLHPPSTTIVEILQRKTPLKDLDLFELIKVIHDEADLQT